MPDAPPPTEPTVREGITCIGCGYDLSTLPNEDGALCPECGTAIEDSLTGPLLRYEGLDWLARVSRGLRQTKVGVTGIALSWAFGIMLLLAVAFGVYGYLGQDTTFELGGFVITNVQIEYAILYAMRIAALLFAAYAALGVWRATTPFEVSAHVEGIDWRLLARAYPFMFLGAILATSIGKRAYIGGLPRNVAAAAFIAVASFALFAGYHAQRRHLSELDGRCSGIRAYEPERPYSTSAIVARVLVIAFFVWTGFERGFDAMSFPILCFAIAWFLLAKRYDRIRERVQAELYVSKPENKA
jgi:hypothetical protein